MESLEEVETEAEDPIEDYEVIGVLEEGRHEIPGHLLLHGTEISIHLEAPEYTGPKDIKINVIGLLETKVIPHASVLSTCGPNDNIEDDSMPAVLLITYLTDLFDNNSNITICFNSQRGNLVVFKNLVDAISNKIKSRINFEGPDLTPDIKPKIASSVGRRRISLAPVEQRAPTFELIDGPSTIMSENEIDYIRLALPYRFRKVPWKRVFLAKKDGVSLETLLQNSRNLMPVLMFIQTDQNVKFGAYVSCGFKTVRGYTGSGETFVFKFAPEIQVFRWSKKNELYVAASDEAITIGGGSTGSAIFLGSNMEQGISDECETFDSPSLCPKNPFKVINCEIWHIKSIFGNPNHKVFEVGSL